MSLTGHFVEKEQIIMIVLACAEFGERHTADNTSDRLTDLIRPYEISDKIVCVMRDNAASQIKALDIASLPHEGCFAHTLQLVLNDGLMKIVVIRDMLSSIRSIVGYFHHSAPAQHILATKCKARGLATTMLIQDVKTRWDSPYDMLERILVIRVAVDDAIDESEAPHRLNESDLQLAEEVEIVQVGD